MSYGLPSKGQHDWDDELNNSMEALRADVQDAVSKANSAQSNANDARNTAQSVGDIATARNDALTAASNANTAASTAAGAATTATSAATTAQDARDQAAASAAAAQAVGNTNDTIISGRINDTTSATRAALNNSIATVKAWARNPDQLIAGTVTRDANGAATSAPVVWPDGTPGTYTADALSTAFPGAVDGYHITYGSPVTKTYTQPTITRDASTGAATNVPAITVA